MYIVFVWTLALDLEIIFQSELGRSQFDSLGQTILNYLVISHKIWLLLLFF